MQPKSPINLQNIFDLKNIDWKTIFRILFRKLFYKPDEMDSDDLDSELEMQNETNEDILFGFDVEDDDEPVVLFNWVEPKQIRMEVIQIFN